MTKRKTNIKNIYIIFAWYLSIKCSIFYLIQIYNIKQRSLNYLNFNHFRFKLNNKHRN